jgi:hypothetical protein
LNLTKQVGSSLKDLAGNPMIAIPVEIELVLGQAWGSTSKIGYTQLYKTQTDTNGLWTAVLPENDLLNPAGTLYRVSEKFPAQYGGNRTYLIQVLSSLGGGLNQAIDLIQPELSPVGMVNTFLTKAYADATYSPVGTSVGPPGPPGTPGASALANVYTLEATLLADTPSNGIYAYATDTGRTWVRLAGAWKFVTGGTHVESMSATLSGGPTSGATPLVLTGTIAVAAVPYARTAIVEASIVKTITVATDTFELSVTDGTTIRASQMVGPGTGLFPHTTPPLVIAIAANATPTLSATMTRIAGTGTASVSGLGANYCRLDAAFKPQE